MFSIGWGSESPTLPLAFWKLQKRDILVSLKLCMAIFQPIVITKRKRKLEIYKTKSHKQSDTPNFSNLRKFKKFGGGAECSPKGK